MAARGSISTTDEETPGLGIQRLVRDDAGHPSPWRRKAITLSATGAIAIVALVALALRATDDRPTAVISVATAPPITLANFDNVERAPSLAPGEACPTTPITTLSSSPMIRVGQGQVAIVPYPLQPTTDDISLPARPYGATGEIAVFWFAAREVGSILVRGYQLDGDDVMRFNDGPNNLSPSVRVLFSQPGTALDMPQGWVHEPDIWLYVNNCGCYAIDILGASGYRDRLIIKVVRT